MPRDRAALIDVLQAAGAVQEFALGMSAEAFLGDRKTQSAVLHQFMLMGEAVKRLSEAFRAAHPEVPWRRIAGLRDRLIHAYDAVDLDAVWQTIQRELPGLTEQLKRMSSEPWRS